MSRTIHFHTLRYDLKPHHPEVVDVLLLQLLLMEVQDEGQVVVQIKLSWKVKRQELVNITTQSRFILKVV